MHKDYFQRNIELMSELRSQHFKYSQYLQRGKYKLKQKFFGKGKKHYDFDINSQQYFHQQINDITFQSSQTQQCFFDMVNTAITQPMKVNNKKRFTQKIGQYSQSLLKQPLKSFPQESQSLLTYPMSISNPSECRVLLSKHFYQRVHDLKYKKYQLQQRYHNLPSQTKHTTILPFLQSRITLIDKQITSSLNRSTRLQHNDNFQQSFIHNGKPIPVSQTGQPIYKYLDEEECWYSSIQRDDILVYTRYSELVRDMLAGEYYPVQAEMKAVVGRDGVEVYLQVESLVEKDRLVINQAVAQLAQHFNSLIEKELQIISPGNLVEKENLTNFGYTIFGILSNSPLTLPLYPAIYPEFFLTLTQSTAMFFNNIKFTTQQQIIQLLPKLNSFCQILFKYQNKEILQGKKLIKLGLDDDIDLKKELHTMLQELWVKKYVNLPFQRYDYKMQIKKVDWPLDSITDEIHRRNNRKSSYQLKMDTSTAQLIDLMTLDDVVTFRKHMKKRAQKILARCQTKYLDMQQIMKYNKKSNQQMTLQQLSDLFRIKHSDEKEKFLKPASQMFLNMIMKKHWLVNPAEIQIEETLRFLSIREDRIKITNILNGLCCYHRNLCMDMRVLTGEEFKFRLDDEFLINSSKQVVENFQKTIKQTATFVTSQKQNGGGDKVNDEFLLQKQYYTRQMLYKKDVVRVKFYGQNANNVDNNNNNNTNSSSIPHILVQNGTKRKSNILYGSVLQHLLPQIQSRILSHASQLINQYQRYIKITHRQQIVDRVRLLQTLYSLQLRFLYQKFKLTQQYYYIYQNTTNILNAFKLSQTITKIIYQQPIIDLNCCLKDDGVTFQQLYQNHIDEVKIQGQFLAKFVQKLKNEEQNHVESFHKIYAQTMKIPLTSQLYLYRDLQHKERTKTRVQRLNSISSKMGSKSSKAVNPKNHNNQNQLIKEEIDEDSARSESSFDIQNYDQYLLKKDMDAIFDDMIQVDDNKDTTPINTTVQQNIVINPRFEGGPHPYNYCCDQVQITTEKKQCIMNFYQTLAFAGNVRGVIEELRQEFSSVYGYVSETYQSYVVRVICRVMKGIILNPPKPLSRWKIFQSSDPYHQTVTQSAKHYIQLMSSAIDPPSNIQMAIASTLQKHQQRLPNFNILSSLDYYSIQSLICLKKPVNTASYRQLALGINYLSFLNMRQSLYMVQLKRQRLIQAYKKIATNCGSSTDRYSSMYTRNGKGTIFLSTQQLKHFKQESYQHPVFPQVLSQLKSLLQCEHADLQLFQTIIKSAKIKVEDMIIMKNQVGRNFINSRFDNSRLLANDAKTVKMIRNRIAGEITSVYNDQIKKNSFLKIKDCLKEKVQYLVKTLNESDLSAKLTLPKEKISQYCKQLLKEKYKRKLLFEIINCYSKDLIENSVKNKVFLQTDSVIKRLKKLVLCTPYMNRVFNLGVEGERVNKKVFYDQKKSSRQQSTTMKPSFEQGIFKPANYIYSRQKLCDQWSQQETLVRMNNLEQFQIHKVPFHPPSDKQQLFKWLYNIPHYSLSQHEQKAINHFIQSLSLPFTGKCSISQFMQPPISIQPPRNKFYTIYQHYSTLLQYIQINYLLVLLQAQDETFQSLRFLLQNDHVNFQQLFQLKDDVSVNESLATMQKQYLKTCFNYKENRQADKQAIKQKVQSRGYSKAKQHWVVYDEIIDFVVGKIQGRGLIRQNFLPFIKQLQSTLSIKDSSPIDLMRKKTQTISHLFVLSTFQAYLNQQHETITQQQQQQQQSSSSSSFTNYLFPILKWFVNNQHQSYQIVSSLSANPRFGIGRKISNDDRNQVQKFILGVFAQNNSRMIKTSSIIERYKAVMMINSVDMNSFVRNLLKSKLQSTGNNTNTIIKGSPQVSGKSLLSNQHNSCNKDNYQQNPLYLYDMSFLPYGMELFSIIGQQNRLKIFSRMRYFYQKVEDYMKIKPNVVKPQQVQDTKLTYVKFIFQSKIQSLAAVVFSAKPNFPVTSNSFKEVSTTLKQQIQKATFTIFDKFEQYKMENKIQFGKSQQKLMAIVQDVKKNQKLANIYNRLIRQVINAKLTREEFKSRVLMESIKLLKNQKIQHIESKKIINTSLIPRVHLIASYSSPLVLDRKTYISQQYKLAFAQAFINRFRNKVSRVDLLSSGYGFVITVPDLQDCVNFMNKLLFTFAEKEFRYRQETSQQYFEILLQAVNEKSRVIGQQQEIIKYLTSKAKNVMQAEYLGKVTDLLHQKTVIEDKLRQVQQSTKGLQDRVRKAVQIQYQKKITSLESQNEILRNKFNEFKQLFVTLTKDSAKNNFLNVANTIREKMGDLLNKRIDVKQAFVSLEREGVRGKQGKIVKEQVHKNEKERKVQQQDGTYTTRDLQRCALGEDIIHDPYYTTKLIQKMRLFNIFKLGAKKIHFQQVEQRKTSELKSLHKIQDTVIVQSQRQIFVREQLKKTQQQLSKKTSQLQKIKQSYEMLDNERTKLKILLAGKDKKIQQKQREAQENIKRMQQIEKLPSLSQSQSKIDKTQEQKPVSKLSEFRKLHNKKSSRIQKSPFVTSIPYEPSGGIYDRFELSNKDATWRQKCQQLYIENKKLLNELEKAHSALTTPTRDGHSLSLRQRKISESFSLGIDQNGNKKEEQLQSREEKRFPNIGFKYNLMKQSLGSFGQ